MKKKNTLFQWVILGIFFFLAVLGFILFSGYEGPKDEKEIKVGTVVIWGTMEKAIAGKIISNLKKENSVYSGVQYIEIERESYNTEILEALASGNSPDLILVSNENIYRNLNKIYPIPYTSIPRRTFIDTYADAFSIYLSQEGVTAIPFLIDPMVMYYNKEIFRTEGLPLPPKVWDDFFDLVKKTTKLNDKENIEQSAVAFGEFSNIDNAKAILSTLMMQLGNNIIENNSDNKYSTVQWKNDFANPVPGLLFFTEFSNQTSPAYSWNRSLPKSKDYFLSGRLATYFGFSSEARRIRLKNPNLNFDVAEIPAVKKINSKTVFAKTWGMAIPKASKNKVGAFLVASELSNESSQSFLVENLNLPPVRKVMLAKGHPEPFMDIFYREAIYANSFIDPNWEETNNIFRFMMDSIKNGRESPISAVRTAFKEINILLEN